MQTVQTLIKCRVLWRLIWVYTVCRYPFYRSLDMNGLTKLLVFFSRFLSKNIILWVPTTDVFVQNSDNFYLDTLFI